MPNWKILKSLSITEQLAPVDRHPAALTLNLFLKAGLVVSDICLKDGSN